MKSYLELIPLSAKVHRRQNRMTILCIVFAVFMVTAIFSMAEMGIRMEYTRLLGKHGVLPLGELLGSSMAQMFLPAAAILALLVLLSGVLMISGSMNSSVAQRTRFFGMLRCIGMSKKQILHFVQLEALNWCRTAAPIGLALGVVVTWGLCAVLRFLVGEEFSDIPLFGVSIVGLLCGALVGVAAVLLAANAPAKRASEVSPIAAVSGNAGREKSGFPAAKRCFGTIETALGVHHAVAARKNLCQMVGSFALSIILFLSFSVIVELAGCLMPQSAATSNLDIVSSGGNSIPPELLETIRGMDGVKAVYGRRSALDIPVALHGDTGGSDTVNLIAYDEFELQSIKKDGALKKGSDLSRVYGDSSFVLATSDETSTWKIGDTVRLGDETLIIAGLLKNDPFHEDGLTHGRITLITSGETFGRLTGETGYALVMVQTTGRATDADVQAVRDAVGDAFSFQDKRGDRTTGTYLAFVFCVDAFLAIIALVTVLNIVNSISMSVSARMKQYGAMRAVGMDQRQVTRMIAAEAFTDAALGCAVGCVLGLPFQKWLYQVLITAHFPYAVWCFPAAALTGILAFVLLAAAAAVYAPAKRICKMPITAVLNEW